MKITTVKKSEDKPETTEILAEAIVRISAAMDKLKQSGLNDRAIIVLIHHDTKINIRDIGTVFDSLSTLRRLYCR